MMIGLKLFILILILICYDSYHIILTNKCNKYHKKSINQLYSSELLPDNFFEVNNQNQLDKPKTLTNYFEIVMSKLGKCSKITLRDLINKYQPNKLPNQKEDMETHITIALESLWSIKNGDWEGLIALASEELDSNVNESDEYIKQCVINGNKLSESKIKELIRKYNESGNIPKFDKRKYKGTLLKADYLASLIDLLREQMDGDYKQVASYLQKESLSSIKKGFS